MREHRKPVRRDADLAEVARQRQPPGNLDTGEVANTVGGVADDTIGRMADLPGDAADTGRSAAIVRGCRAWLRACDVRLSRRSAAACQLRRAGVRAGRQVSHSFSASLSRARRGDRSKDEQRGAAPTWSLALLHVFFDVHRNPPSLPSASRRDLVPAMAAIPSYADRHSPAHLRSGAGNPQTCHDAARTEQCRARSISLLTEAEEQRRSASLSVGPVTRIEPDQGLAGSAQA